MNLKILLVLITFLNFNLYAELNPDKKIEINSETEKTSPLFKGETSLAMKIDSEDKKSYHDAPLTEDEIISLLKEKHRGSIIGKIMESYPRLTKLAVRLNLDKEVKKVWSETLKDKTRYFVFLAIFLLTAAINWAWRRSQANRMVPLWESIKGWLLRFSLINFSRLALFIILFEFELRPVWAIVRKTFQF
jgi:hypothetical protein